MHLRSKVTQIQHQWDHMLHQHKYSMKAVYSLLIDDMSRSTWSKLFLHNYTRPKAKFTTWMLCHGKLPTKDRLMRFGIAQDSLCRLCGVEEENANHIFFSCPNTITVWMTTLTWLGVNHKPLLWEDELKWVLACTKGKGWRATVLKTAFTEAIHETWLLRNATIFDNTYKYNSVERIIDCIVYRCWGNRKIRPNIARLMI